MGDLSALLEDPLAHRALDALVRAESRLTRRLSTEFERRGLSGTGFSMLVVLESAGGRLELRALRQRLGVSKANASEVLSTLARRDLVRRERSERDGRALTVWLTRTGDTRLLARDGALLWVAHWGVDSPTLPADDWDGHGWVVWQYSSTGRVPGISGHVDLDVLAGTRLGRVTIRRLSVAVNGDAGFVSGDPARFE